MLVHPQNLLLANNQNQHSYGVAAGGEALASSVTSAMEGVFVRTSLITLPMLIFYQVETN
jgi:hypothetical protein